MQRGLAIWESTRAIHPPAGSMNGTPPSPLQETHPASPDAGGSSGGGEASAAATRPPDPFELLASGGHLATERVQEALAVNQVTIDVSALP